MSHLLEAVTSSSSRGDVPLAPRLAPLVDAYASSPIAAEIKAETEDVVRVDGNGQLRDVAEEHLLLRG